MENSDYLKDIEKHLGKSVDIILINNKSPSKEQIKIQASRRRWVLVGDSLKDVRVVRRPLLSPVLTKHQITDNIKI